MFLKLDLKGRQTPMKNTHGGVLPLVKLQAKA